MVKKVLFLLALGLLAGALAFGVSADLEITGNMPGQVNLFIVGDEDIALGELVDGASGSVTVSESSNKDGYTVDLSSANGWGLKHADLEEYILYQFSYAGTTFTPALGDGDIQIVESGVKTTGQTTNDNTFAVEVPSVGNPSAGNYADTLTFTLTAP